MICANKLMLVSLILSENKHTFFNYYTVSPVLLSFNDSCWAKVRIMSLIISFIPQLDQSAGHRIHWLSSLQCNKTIPPPRKGCPWYDAKLNLMISLKCWRS